MCCLNKTQYCRLQSLNKRKTLQGFYNIVSQEYRHRSEMKKKAGNSSNFDKNSVFFSKLLEGTVNIEENENKMIREV